MVTTASAGLVLVPPLRLWLWPWLRLLAPGAWEKGSDAARLASRQSRRAARARVLTPSASAMAAVRACGTAGENQ